ncbi:MAG TPA: glutathione S-transferase family protein [Stellaceae bacterium]|nr:glutathione S-transferase family protein [Stellaceae bacterium]
MLVLYFSPGSSSMATHIALHEIGAPFETRLIALSKKEQHRADYLAVNPEGKVPTLLIEGRPLTEVAATLYYLAKTYPAAELWPAGGIEEEAQALSWMSFIASTVHPARRIGDDRWGEVFGLAEERLGAKEWCVGGRYSIADIHLFRLFWRFFNTLHPEPAAYPQLYRHYERMMARPAVRKTCEIESALGYNLPR